VERDQKREKQLQHEQQLEHQHQQHQVVVDVNDSKPSMMEQQQHQQYLPIMREFDREPVISMKSQVYEAHLYGFISKLAEEGNALSLSFTKPDALGQDMSVYSDIGCSVFNRLYNTNSNNHTLSSAYLNNQQRLLRRGWSSHLASILDASRHADDPTFDHRNWTNTLLRSLSPYTLLDSLPSDGSGTEVMDAKDAERIVGIIIRRLLGLIRSTNSNNSTQSDAPILMPPPLRIAIFGGPTVAGKGCLRARVGMPRYGSSMMANPAFCAFPYRLEKFLNGMLLPPAVLNLIRDSASGSSVRVEDEFRLVEVINLGEEGTYSGYSEAIVRNRMYPPLMNGPSVTGYGGGPPDLVIHAYSIDDYGRDTTNIDSFYNAVSNHFVEVKEGCTAEDRKPPPVVIRAILESDVVSQLQSSLSTMTSILGDAVDDVEEGELSIPVIESAKGDKLDEGGAFGMAGHVATSWALAFDLAYASLNHCVSIAGKANDSLPQHPIIHKQIPTNDHQQMQQQISKCDNGIDPPCIFSFLAGSKGNAARPSFILSTIMPFVVENTGWQPGSDMTAGFARKTGLVGTGTGATMTLLFRNVTRPVRRLDIMTLRSTSDTWREGAARFVLVTGGDFSHGDEAAEASAETAREVTFEISAELIADTSSGEEQHITYHFGLDIDEESVAELGSDVLLRMILTKGRKFKVLGIMLCE